MTSSQVPFVGNFNFLVEIEGVTPDSTAVVCGFSEVSGISSSSDVIEFRVGNSRSAIKVPGRTRTARTTSSTATCSTNCDPASCPTARTCPCCSPCPTDRR